MILDSQLSNWAMHGVLGVWCASKSVSIEKQVYNVVEELMLKLLGEGRIHPNGDRILVNLCNDLITFVHMIMGMRRKRCIHITYILCPVLLIYIFLADMCSFLKGIGYEFSMWAVDALDIFTIRILPKKGYMQFLCLKSDL